MNSSDHYPPDPWHIRDPFWRSQCVHGESLFFIRESPDQPASARLLFPPDDSLILTSASRETVYSVDVDYVVDPGERSITLPPESRIPFTDHHALYRGAGQELAIAHKLGDEAVWLYHCEGHHFHDRQVEASYRHDSTWQGSVPEFQGHLLPRTTARLDAGESLSICVCGDSIAGGANASSCVGASPAMPPFRELFAQELRRRYAGVGELTDVSVGGIGTHRALELVDSVSESKPDLVVIAFGMNDAGWLSVDEYVGNIAKMVERIRADAPAAEIILVASMLGNPEWHNTPMQSFFGYRDGLKSLCCEGVALADLTQMWSDLLQCKTYHDLTGNGVNHPNDFGHRTYAQVLLDVLVPLAGGSDK